MHAVILSLAALIGAAASPAPSPSPSPSPSAPSDPCGSILSIVTRPTVTTSVCTVRPHNVLIEGGYSNTQTTGAGGGTSVAYPQAYLRFGTSDPRLEFDVTPPSTNASSVGGTTAGGASDVGLGAKYELGYSVRWLYGVNAAITYPTGSRAFSAGADQYAGNFNWSYTVNQVIGLSGTMGFNSLSGFDAANVPQSYFAFVPSFVASASLPGPSEFYVEYTYFTQAGVGLGGKNLIDSAFLRDFGNSIQLDVEYGFSPTLLDGQRQHYLGAGASFMF
jgi:hypothetical protein